RLAYFIDSQGPRVVAAARRWQVPTLLMYAGADRLVRAGGSRAFAADAPSDLVTSRCFDGLYHEIFNEQDPSAVYGALRVWLDQRAPA
ncbi:MAG: serine aminopeptidase domain-containing protein, partial [Hydrogenophaga sp.]